MDKDKDDAAELREEDGSRPTEIAGPGECDASPIRCEEKATAGDQVHECTFSADAELQESFPVEEIPVYEGEDGLPVIATPPTESSEAVPFAYETVVCIEDERQFLEIFHEDASEDLLTIVNNMQNSERECHIRSKYNSKGLAREMQISKPNDVKKFWGQRFATKRINGKTIFFPVRPTRERCQYYKRQVFSNDDQPDPSKFGHQIVFRLCEKRRSNGGAFMSLMNEGVYCCDFRNPEHMESIATQDAKDKNKLELRPHELRVPMFGIVGDDIQVKKDKNNV